MRRIIISLLLLVIASVAYTQINYQDVVYLKNGSIIRGFIIEQVPNESINIETSGGNIFVYQMEEIEKLTKEKEAVKKSEILNIEQTPTRGYIGLTIGPSVPVGNFSDQVSGGLASTGIQLTLINFAHLFKGNTFGIAATWFGAANFINLGFADPWAYGGLMIGPLIRHTISERLGLDVRPMIGYADTTDPFFSETVSSVAFQLGTIAHYNVGKKIALLLSVDYFHTNPEFIDSGFEQKIGTISFAFGAAYVFRR